MKKLNTSPLSGTQELLPQTQAVFNEHKKHITETFKSYGFQNIETPIIDRDEILFAKAGGDTEKQIYRVIKTTESADDSTQALRFDHTVPLARYIAEHQSDIAFPFRVSQIGRNFRGERAQKGRFREFYQCDVDILGRNTLPIAYDAEVIATLAEALSTFDLPGLEIRISNRKLLTGLLESIAEETRAEIFSIVDHAEKVPPETTMESLNSLNLPEDIVVKITTFINIKGNSTEVSQKLDNLDIQNETFNQGKAELLAVLKLLEDQEITAAYADMLIVRGLDYYTGTVFETFMKDYHSLGSICSGGRYENLTSFYSAEKFPGVGGSIGLTRLFYVLSANGLLREQIVQPVDIAIIPISGAEQTFATNLAKKLRQKGNSTDVILTDKKLGDKLTHASRIAKSAIVVGESEKNGETPLKIKDFATGETRDLL